MIEFFDEDNKSGMATIYDRHVLFNSKLKKFFDSAYRVRVGIDKDTNELYFFMINKDYALSGEINESSLPLYSFPFPFFASTLDFLLDNV